MRREIFCFKYYFLLIYRTVNTYYVHIFIFTELQPLTAGRGGNLTDRAEFLKSVILRSK